MNGESAQDSVNKSQIQARLQKGIVLHRQGKLDRALNEYIEVLDQDSGNADANHLTGLLLLARKKGDDLIRSLEYLTRAIDIDSNQSTFHNDLGNAYWNLGRISEAEKSFCLAIERDADFVQPRFNLGNCYWIQGDFKQARQAYADTLRLNADWAQARYMLGNCEYTLGNTKKAISVFREVVARRPELIDAQLGLAHALLRSGQWPEGWQYFDSRLLFDEFSLYQSCNLPQWDGCDAAGKTLLVIAEQGIGDTLHFFRYLALAREKVGKLVLVCDRSLHSLLSGQTEVDDIIYRDTFSAQTDEADFDFQISLMSLARVFQSTPDTLWTMPYLQVDRTKSKRWQYKINSKKLHAGIVWAGNSAQKDDKYRSCKFEHLLPLFKLPDIQFYSLQKGPVREQMQHVACTEVVDIADELLDFSDTAAVIENLDMVISVDTAVAHLAGALGTPVWTMLWYSHCWRYLENRADSPWYPSMRLFRQKKIGDWSHVVDEIAAALIKKVQSQVV